MTVPERKTSEGQTLSNLPEINLEQVAGYDVCDKAGERIGSIAALWADHTGQPAFLGVRTSWLLGRTHVVPAEGAQVNQQHERVRLPYSEDEVQNAPHYDPEADLDFSMECEVLYYYRIREPLPTEREPGRAAAPSAAQAVEQTRTTPPPAERAGQRGIEAGGTRWRKIVRAGTVPEPAGRPRQEAIEEGEGIYIPLRREESEPRKAA